MSVGHDSIGQTPPSVATPPPRSDRRFQQRISEDVHAEISPWLGDRTGTAFGVIVRNLSTTGAGIVHSGRLQLGAKYLLEIPRPHLPPIATIFTVMRCDETDGGLFNVELSPESVLSVAVGASIRRQRRTPLPGDARNNIKLLIALLLVVAATAVYLKLTF